MTTGTSKPSSIRYTDEDKAEAYLAYRRGDLTKREARDIFGEEFQQVEAHGELGDLVEETPTVTADDLL
ncbi:MAG: hypothetical protein ABEJ31_01450 [Haloarculaceae archaeon]